MKKVLGFPKYLAGLLKSVVQEIKLVEFPTRKRTIRMTNIVLLVSLVFVLFLLGLDTLFVFIRNYLTNI